MTFTRREMQKFLDDLVKNVVPDDFEVDRIYTVIDEYCPTYRASLLFYACEAARKPAAIHKLIELGADPNILNNFGHNPFGKLVLHEDPYLFAIEILLLLQAGSSFYAHGVYGSDGVELDTSCSLVDGNLEIRDRDNFVSQFSIFSMKPSVLLTGLQKYIISLCNEKCDYHVLKVIAANISSRTIEYTFVLDLVIGDW